MYSFTTVNLTRVFVYPIDIWILILCLRTSLLLDYARDGNVTRTRFKTGKINKDQNAFLFTHTYKEK